MNNSPAALAFRLVLLLAAITAFPISATPTSPIFAASRFSLLNEAQKWR